MFRSLVLSLLLISCVASAEARQQTAPHPAPSPNRTQTPKAPPTVQTPRVPQVSQQNPTVNVQIKPRVFSVVQKLNAAEVLTLLKRSGAEIKTVDSNFVFNFAFHTNIVAGFPLGDGKTVVTRLPQAEMTTWYYFTNTRTSNGAVKVTVTAQGAVTPVPTTSPQTPTPKASTTQQQQSLYSTLVGSRAQLKSEKVAKTPLPPKGVSLQPIAGPDGNILVFSEDGREFTARFVGLDGWTGLSLLQIEGLQQTPLPEADAYKLALEQSVGLIAPTLAQPGPGVTGKLALKLDKIKGRLKTLERNSTGEIKQMTFITENAENISPAFVGGIVVNDANEAIGMIQTVMLKEAKVIPIADIKEAVARVQLQAALAPRPWLGARGEAITASSLQQLLLTGWGKEQAQNLLTQRRGVLLTSIPPETPAALARLKVGDVVLGINQNQVANADEFTRLLTQSETGQDLLFTVIRPNSATEQNFKVKLGETPDPMLAMLRAEYRALRLRSKDLFERLGMDTLQLDPNPFDKRRPFKHGHYVSYVYPDSAAAKAGLQAGDVIEAINGKRLYGPFVWQITREPKEITLTIVRSEQKLTIKINPNEEEKR